MKRYILIFVILALLGGIATLQAAMDPLSIGISSMNQSERFNSENTATRDMNRLAALADKIGSMTNNHGTRLTATKTKVTTAQNKLLQSLLDMKVVNRRFL